ncbi:MAG: flagellar protein FlbB [Xanthobacteraceae bacterium]|nr:MAG: flagellar protein FlbB [Xanthobacteraceae bacterium]
MKKFGDIRLLPVVLVAVACLMILKVTGLVLDGGYVFDGAGEPRKLSWAQDVLNYPPGRDAAADVTGSVGADKPKDAAASPATKPADDARPDGSVVVMPEPGKTVSLSERAVLERLQARRLELDTRAREIEIRDNLVKAAEKRLEARIEELKAIEARISAANERKDQAEAARLKGLVAMYENMKPKDAAKVFDRLEMGVLFEIASQIAPRKMSDVLAQMSAEAAERLTVELARRSSAGKSDVSNLPKIEGKTARP